MEEVKLPSQVELDKADGAAKDRIRQAFEKQQAAKTAYEKAVAEARNSLADGNLLKTRAVEETRREEEEKPSEKKEEERAEQNREKNEVRRDGGSVSAFPPLPVSVVKEELKGRAIDDKAAKLRKKLEAFTGSTLEEAIELWSEVMHATRQGLPVGRVMDEVNDLPKDKRALFGCGTGVVESEEVLRQELQARFATSTEPGDLRDALRNLRRGPQEAAHAFILRAMPLVGAAVQVGAVRLEEKLQDLWCKAALGEEWVVANETRFDAVAAKIRTKDIRTLDGLQREAFAFRDRERVPGAAAVAAPAAAVPEAVRAPVTAPVVAPAAPAVKNYDVRPHCRKCKGRHFGECWKCPECKKFGHNLERGPPCAKARAARGTKSNGAQDDECVAAMAGKEVLAVAARVGGQGMTLGLDTLAAVNLIRRDALPEGVVVNAGGPRLHGVGSAQAAGTVELRVQVGGLSFEQVSFAVVDELPVQALVGKPTLASMRAVLEVANGVAQLRQGEQTARVRAIAVPARGDSSNTKAQSYWNWLNRRFAKANTRLQAVFQDVCGRADDAMLEKFLASFPEWSLKQRRESGKDDPNVHPAPLRPDLARSTDAAITTGVVVCPILVKAESILRPSDAEELLSEVAEHDDSKDFLPPVMSFEEEDAKVEKELQRLVDESEFTTKGKARLRAILNKYRSTFGMQLRQVQADRDQVETTLTGTPEHQPRRRIRDPRVMRAQVQWERAMLERGVIGELTGKAELARPINIHHVIRNGKIRFTADAKPLNDVTVVDSFPVPSPMEALDRFRRNKVFSTFDEADSYFQYPYAEGSRVPFYSAEGGIREFRVVIQGGKNSPAVLHHFKAKQYQEFSPDELAFMFDDTLLGTDGAEEKHLDLLERFLANCAKSGTILKPSKANIGKAEVKHQGFVLGHGYYRKDPEAVRALADMSLPTTAAELKSQLSMLGRYCEFAPEYAQLAVPLEAIMDKRWAPETFTVELQERLIEIRRCVAQETMLTMPDWNRPFHWRIDASPTYGWAG
ncbi:MAG: reverse transcriptase domain-containing protein, partial [Roseimicrobium sp.]